MRPERAVHPRRRDGQREREPVRRAVHDRAARSPAARPTLVADHITGPRRPAAGGRASPSRSPRSRCWPRRPRRGWSGVLAEHIDTASYRLRRVAARPGQPAAGPDAGAAASRLDGQGRRRPVPRRLRLARGRATDGPALTPAPAARRRRAPTSPAPRRCCSDPANGGYVHAPSLHHAGTAARAAQRLPGQRDAAPTRARSRSTCPPNGSGWRWRCWRACAPARASARCWATGSSAACTTLRRWPSWTSSSSRSARRSRSSPTGSPATTGPPPDVPIEAIEARNVT